MSAQLEDAWKEYERTGEICNSAEGLLNHCTVITEHLRLKEEENKQLQQDKAELVEALKALVKVEHERGGTLGVSGSFNYPVPEGVFIKAKKLLEKHK